MNPLLQKILTREAWGIALRTRTQAQSGSPFRFLPVHRDRFYADPFLFGAAGRSVLFFEDYRYGDRKALISACEVRPDGGWGEIRTCLERPYHLSYPFVLAFEGSVFMIPESSNAYRVELYRATDFPWRWELHSVLLDEISLADATLFQRDSRWWMFANSRSPDGRAWKDLCLFYADTPLGPWRPHPRNPVVTSFASSRPAGRVLHRGNDWLRPSQDSSRVYGEAVVFNRIEELTPETYRETQVASLGPDWLRGNTGTHTYCLNESFEAVDFRFRVPRRPLPYQWQFEQRPWKLSDLFGSHDVSS